MTSKKTSEITFKEFIEASKAAKNLLIDNVETDMLTKMRQEGILGVGSWRWIFATQEKWPISWRPRGPMSSCT